MDEIRFHFPSHIKQKVPMTNNIALYFHVFPQVGFLREVSVTLIVLLSVISCGFPGARVSANIASKDPRASANGARNLKPGKTSRWPSA